MARKAPPKGQRKRKSASAPRKAQTRGAAAPSRRKAATPAGKSAYEKRIERYLREHPGATRQEARGHKRAEHVTRREREIAKLEAFAEQQAAKFRGGDSEEILDALMARYRRQGIGFLALLQAEIAQMHARYMRQTARDKRGRRPSLGINMDKLAEIHQLPPETFGYH